MVRLSHLSISLSNKDPMWIKIGFRFFVILHMNKDLSSFFKKEFLHNFKGHFTFIIIIQSWLCFPCCAIHPSAYPKLSSLPLPLSHPEMAPSPQPGNPSFVPFLLYQLVCHVFSISYISDIYYFSSSDLFHLE